MLVVIVAASTLGAAGRTGPSTGTQDADDEEVEFAHARAELVRTLRRQGIEDDRVLEAIGRVPRHEFVGSDLRHEAYGNYPLPIGHEQTISQPYIVALMSEVLHLQPGDRVLEIGTGSGYQAAVLSEMGCEVYSIEIVAELAEAASKTLSRLGYESIHQRVGDGYLGWPERAPFEAVIVTAAPISIPRALVDQLAAGGRMVLPIGEQFGNQTLTVVQKDATGRVSTREIAAVRFVPMVKQRSQ